MSERTGLGCIETALVLTLEEMGRNHRKHPEWAHPAFRLFVNPRVGGADDAAPGFADWVQRPVRRGVGT